MSIRQVLLENGLVRETSVFPDVADQEQLFYSEDEGQLYPEVLANSQVKMTHV